MNRNEWLESFLNRISTIVVGNQYEQWIRIVRVGTNSGTNWEKGIVGIEESKDRGFGEVYLALDKKSNDQVVVKRVQMKMDDSTVQNEVKMLKECGSKYIVRYFDLVKVGNELWV